MNLQLNTRICDKKGEGAQSSESTVSRDILTGAMEGTAFVLAVIVCGAAATITLNSTHDKIHPSVTQSIKLTCQVKPDGTMKLVTSMTMFFTPDLQPQPPAAAAGGVTAAPATASPPPAPMKVSLVSVVRGMINPNPNNRPSMQVDGNIGNGQDISTIEIIIDSPTDQDTGVYSCQANGFSPAFMPIKDHKDKHILLQATTQQDLNQKVRQMEADVKLMRQRWDQVDSSSIFHKSNGIHQGSRYLLSQSAVEHINVCQFMCTVEGGYLAEIDNEAEFKFVQQFVQSKLSGVSDFPDVFIGATDKGHKGQFTFMQNAQKKPFLTWGGFASNGYDCLTLSQNSGYFMNDFDCEESNRFLCEIPV